MLKVLSKVLQKWTRRLFINMVNPRKLGVKSSRSICLYQKVFKKLVISLNINKL